MSTIYFHLLPVHLIFLSAQHSRTHFLSILYSFPSVCNSETKSADVTIHHRKRTLSSSKKCGIRELIYNKIYLPYFYCVHMCVHEIHTRKRETQRTIKNFCLLHFQPEKLVKGEHIEVVGFLLKISCYRLSPQCTVIYGDERALWFILLPLSSLIQKETKRHQVCAHIYYYSFCCVLCVRKKKLF